jgi:hypothetical protein
MPAPGDLPDAATREALASMPALSPEQADALAQVLDRAATRVRRALIDAATERGRRDGDRTD